MLRGTACQGGPGVASEKVMHCCTGPRYFRKTASFKWDLECAGVGGVVCLLCLSALARHFGKAGLIPYTLLQLRTTRHFYLNQWVEKMFNLVGIVTAMKPISHCCSIQCMMGDFTVD